METIPVKCMNDNTVGSFCECIANADSVDAAARGFCDLAKTESGKNITGDDLAELKKALMDMEARNAVRTKV